MINLKTFRIINERHNSFSFKKAVGRLGHYAYKI